MKKAFVAQAIVALSFATTAASAQDPKLIARGTYLMDSVVACGNCHVQRDKEGRPLVDRGLSGGMLFDEDG